MNRAAPLNELGIATLRSQKKPLTRPRILPLDICLQISDICLEISVRLILQNCTLVATIIVHLIVHSLVHYITQFCTFETPKNGGSLSFRERIG